MLEGAEVAILVLLLSSLLGLLSPSGVVLEEVARGQIRDRLESADEVAVRIDNTPTHQLLNGRVDRLRIAGRGLEPLDGIYISVVEVETDPIHLDLEQLDEGRDALQEPLRAGVRLVLTEEDILRTLQSPRIADRLQGLNLDAFGASSSRRQRYNLVNPQVQFLPEQRVRLEVTVQAARSQQSYPIQAEFRIAVANGHQLQIRDLSIRFNNQPVPAPLLNALTRSLERSLDLKRLEDEGVVARVLQFEISEEEMAIAGFIQVNPAASSSGN